MTSGQLAENDFVMFFTIFNIRGLNKSSHEEELKNFILVNKVDFVDVLKTKVKHHKASILANRTKSG